jgi:hypothetical protein|tara:strand:+ start:6524 stop:6940 length:417 start_codon:yes stop_codon:yes gene_type:complete
MKLIFALFCLVAGHLLAWLQLNGPIFNNWWKDNIWISALCVSPVIFFFSMSYWSITYDLLQTVWPVKFIAYGVNIIVFSICAYYFLGESLFTIRNIVSIIFATLMILSQAYLPKTSIFDAKEKTKTHVSIDENTNNHN